jgi:glycosyltransferase involved in cell wall biosynthesis
VLTHAARRAGIPVLFLCHQLVEPDSGGYEWPIARLALRHADAFISLTSVERDILARAFPGRPVVGGFLPVFDQRAPQGIDGATARQLLGIAADVRVILFFGFVRRYKGLRTLLDALARLPDDVHLLIAGEFWEDEAEYRAQIARLGLTARVHIHAGYIPDEAVEPFFAASDVVALPYLSGSQSGVGMLAVNYAVPIVVSAVGGLGEMIEDGVDGIIVPPADPGALAAALGTTLEPAVNQRMRSALARLRQRRSWDALVDLIDATLTPSPTRKDAS